MCGVTAMIDAAGDPASARARLEQMTDALAHRGPDDRGVWQSPDGALFLGHRRLAIVDLSPAGRNPMAWHGGRYLITYNGEVYNFAALRRELEASGARFSTLTDTEVILAAYERWDTRCFEKFVGMFAMAIWDDVRRRLVLVRDRVGKKPLYYAQYGGRLAVASELKAFAADPAFPREVDPRAVATYLHYGYVPAPLTIYAHAAKLPPGHFAVFDAGGGAGGPARVERYWDPFAAAVAQDGATTEVDVERRLEELLLDAVALRMIADVPLGAFLSGGIDSSLVVSLMKELSSTPVKTFTIRFDDPAYNEADHAAAVARHLGTEHHEQACAERDMLEVVDMLPDMFDEPFADSSAIPTYLVSRTARQRVTVALSGDGGDELFFGYPRYRHQLRASWLLDAPRLVRRTAASLAAAVPRRRFQRAAEILRLDAGDRYERFISFWDQPEIEALAGVVSTQAPAYLEARCRTAALPLAVQAPLIDLVTYLPDDILAKVDRASMRVSLEARCPLLDHRIVEFAMGLSMDYKWRQGETKWILRRILERRVPRALFDRPKMGFGVPIAAWLRGPLRLQSEALFAGPALERVGVDGARARQVHAQFLETRTDYASRVWSLFVLAGWSERWLS